MTFHPIDTLSQAKAVTSEFWKSRPKYLVAGTSEGLAHWVYLRCRPEVSDGELIDAVISYAEEAAAVCVGEFDAELRDEVDRSERYRATVDPLWRDLGTAVAKLRSSPRRWRAYVRFCDLALSNDPQSISEAWSLKSRLETAQVVYELVSAANDLAIPTSAGERQLAISWEIEVREKMLTLDTLLTVRGFAASQHWPTERLAIAQVLAVLRDPAMRACLAHYQMLQRIHRPSGTRVQRSSSIQEVLIPRRARPSV